VNIFIKLLLNFNVLYCNCISLLYVFITFYSIRKSKISNTFPVHIASSSPWGFYIVKCLFFYIVKCAIAIIFSYFF